MKKKIDPRQVLWARDINEHIEENGRYISPEYNLLHRMHCFLFETENGNLYPA